MVFPYENKNSEPDDNAWYAVVNAVNTKNKNPSWNIREKMCTILKECNPEENIILLGDIKLKKKYAWYILLV